MSPDQQNEWKRTPELDNESLGLAFNDGTFTEWVNENILDQIRREAVEEHNKKGSWELTAQSVKEIELEAKKELLDKFLKKCDSLGISMPNDKVVEHYIIPIDKFNKFRAKTLGEK